MHSKFVKIVLLVALLLLTAAIALNRPATAENALWTAVPETDIALRGERHIIPQRYLTYQLNLSQLESLLATAPLEFTEAGRANPLILPLPLPDGTLADFALVESPIMEPELAAKFPTFKTYAGRMVADPTATVRLDVTLHGFHAMMITSAGTFFIDPYSTQDTSHYIVYAKNDYERDTGFLEIGVLDDFGRDAATLERNTPAAPPTGPQLYTYRLAVAATGEYTAFHGGTVGAGLAAIVTAVNRVNQVYERDTAIRMVLVANNNTIVYTNSGTDPYTNGSPGTMITQNQTNLDTVIGNANYDIGHVFGTNSGGLAGLGVTCRTGQKARGVTGSGAPIGDPFWIDYVAHELGHQYDALHTFNGNAGSCSGNRSGSAAYEPGSGTTVMAYAGICGAQDIQPNSDDHFHTFSIDEIVNYTRNDSGNACAAITNTGNTAPTANAGTGGFTIPINTPFTLTGTGSDADAGDVLSYNWEQFDLGPAGAPNSPSGNAPIFRSFPSTSSPSRTFPRWADIVNNTQTIGEILPSYTRSLSFRLTVRDNNVAPSAGGVNTSLISFNVTNAAGPFLVTAPNTAVTWTGNQPANVTWNVANTTAAPVSCAAVDIRLSTDGGFTYPTLLLANTPNDGAASVTSPNITTSTARVMVKCATSIFFDISNTNFNITPSTAVAQLQIGKTAVPATGANVAPGATITYTIGVTNTGTLTGTVTVTDTFAAPLGNPICNAIPGDLQTTVPVGIGQNTNFTCTAVVNPALAVELTHTADQAAVDPGTAVTYTIAVTNPNSVSLANVVVTANHGVSCSPALGTPFGLAPSASASFVCANVVINSGVTYTAEVSANIAVHNTATASAPEAISNPVTSNTVSHVVPVAAEEGATVVIASALQISKAAVPSGPLTPGQTVTYTILVTNTGDLPVTATIMDTFAAPLTNPVCNDTAGDLLEVVVLGAQESAEFVCTAEVSALIVELAQVVDAEVVEAGTAVTYTITVTNPNAVALDEVVVTAPYGGSCTPAPETPTTLAALASAVYVCPNMVISETVVTTATVTAQVAVHNTAEASAPEVVGGSVASNTVSHLVPLVAEQAVTVTVGLTQPVIYLPFIQR